ncbi:SAM-dependent methyltransferase [Streptomyces sp. Wb2n-11]|uniref:SAM-dependent methyltransferase n=1 Tax=Streptomyces sp. Wb2n-11 TaxID=1030533 RepID=UPI000B885B47
MRNCRPGGKDHYAAGQEAGDRIRELRPGIGDRARAAGRGIRRFPDTGTAPPAAGRTYEAARRPTPESRIVHAGDGPPVLAHACALPTGTPDRRGGPAASTGTCAMSAGASGPPPTSRAVPALPFGRTCGDGAS